LESELNRLGRTARERRRKLEVEARIAELTKVRRLTVCCPAAAQRRVRWRHP
jgi:hypothetical protein